MMRYLRYPLEQSANEIDLRLILRVRKLNLARAETLDGVVTQPFL